MKRTLSVIIYITTIACSKNPEPPTGNGNQTLISTEMVAQISRTSAICGGFISDDGGRTILERGIVYYTNPNPDYTSPKVKNGLGTGNFSCSMTGLSPNTTYYVRAYARNNYDYIYGPVLSFKTLAANAPDVGNITVNALVTINAFSSFNMNGTVNSDNGSAILQRGFVYSTTGVPTTSDNKIILSGTTGTLSTSLSGLTPNTTYYIRAYAINSIGTSYSQTAMIITPAIVLATISTSSISGIGTTSAICGITKTSLGGGTVIDQGICWSLTNPPTISNSKATSSSTSSSFTISMTGLQSKKTYYVRAFLTNQAGTQYGSTVSFTTN